MWVQDAAGVRLAEGSLFAGVAGSLCTGSGDVSRGSSSPGSVSTSFDIFGGFFFGILL